MSRRLDEPHLIDSSGCDTMFNMVGRRDVRALKIPKPQHRTRYVGTRLRETDAAELADLAKAEGVGISAYTRMILEAFVASRRKGK